MFKKKSKNIKSEDFARIFKAIWEKDGDTKHDITYETLRIKQPNN